jgi:hypothetical protein
VQPLGSSQHFMEPEGSLPRQPVTILSQINPVHTTPSYLIKVNLNVVRFEVFTAVTMKNDVLWDVTPCGSCKNRRFGGT